MSQIKNINIYNSIRNWIKNIIAPFWLLMWLIVFSFTKKTPIFAYQSMIRTFCISKGYSNDILSNLFGFIRRPYLFWKDADGILGNMSTHERDTVVEDLRTNWYHVFKSRLPDELCDKLLNYAITQKCVSRPMDGEWCEKEKYDIFPRLNPEAIRYDFKPQDLLKNQDIQNLLADMSFSAVASDYLWARPIIDVLSMWWHTAFSDMPDMNAAQYYHFDMDRPKWLKFFIYLTDVTTDTGAHTFIEGSHKTNGIPSSMLKKWYARLTDEEVEAFYWKEKVVEFIAPRGTIIAEDTRGLHKWKHVKQHDRLILQIQFSNSMFGWYYPKAKLEKELSKSLQEKISKYPDLYSNYN